MMVLITYDVSLENEGGARRLRKVAKVCENIGQRVQKSVFECIVEPAQFLRFKNDLLNIIDPKKDSLRVYFLGSNWQRRVEKYGVALSFEQDGLLVL